MKIFRGNDIRGIYGKEITDDLAYNLGRVFVKFTKAKEVIVGRDVRVSSYALNKALVDGLTEQGANVIDLGLVDTPGLYFATSYWKLPGIMITASHNPANENGFYLCKAFARPINETSGLKKIEAFTKGKFVKSKTMGKVRSGDISAEYVKHLLSFVQFDKLKKLNIVIDAGNGMGAWASELVYGKLPISINRLNFNLDGRFPGRGPDTSISSALVDLQNYVVNKKAHFGLAFDGDADRVVFVDDLGRVVEGSVLGTIIASYLLKRSKNKRVVYSSTCSRILPESVAEYGGRALKERVGHTFVQERMWKSKALLGVEDSGHYFYQDNKYADSGIITSLLMCQIYSEADKSFSALVDKYSKYYKAENVSFNVRDPDAAFKKIKTQLKKVYKNAQIFDGISVSEEDYWFNIRLSETQPLIRLNIEGISKAVVDRAQSEIIKLIRTCLGGKR